jgi:acetyl-CoA acetyltransferase
VNDDAIVIAAYAETPVVFRSGRSAYDLAGEASAALLARAQLAPRDVDGLSVTLAISEAGNPFFAVFVTEALGFEPTWLTAGAIGGCSALGGVARAASAIRDGQCRIAMVLSADAPSTRFPVEYGAHRPEFADPVGLQSPPVAFGLLMSRYAHQYDLEPEALGKIAVVQRRHALANPNALEKFRVPLELEEYLAARPIADPLRVLDCVMFCDGANALLVTTAGEARMRGWPAVHVRAAAEVTNYRGADPLADITETGFSHIAPRLFARAGLEPRDIAMLQLYDDFTIAVLLQLEAFGFCARGQGSAFVLATDLAFDGRLPLNTGGGQISAGQPGLAGGGLTLVEAVRQLLGEGGARQVQEPRNALVTGIGAIPYGRNWSISAAMILETGDD